MPQTRTAQQRLGDLIRARYGIVGIRTVEERRVWDILVSLREQDTSLKRNMTSVASWSVTSGWMEQRFKQLDGASVAPPGMLTPTQTRDLVLALDHVKSSDRNGGQVFVFNDLDVYLSETGPDSCVRATRALREVIDALKGSCNTLILVGASLVFEGALAEEIPIIDWPLPNVADLRFLVKALHQDWRAGHPGTDGDWGPQLEHSLTLACQGMTWQDAEDAMAEASGSLNGYTFEMLNIVAETKQNRLRSVAGLEIVSGISEPVEVGGLDVLSSWVAERKTMFGKAAQDFGIELAKGIMTVGVPGAGKSLAARMLAHEWGIPLYRVNVAALYNQYVGNTEQNVRRLLRNLEAAAPCVAWFDEIEKALANGGGDNGTSSRLFGEFLTWMEERNTGVVCYFTANDVSRIPPELMRMGRLDEQFFVGLPGHAGRVDIWRIQLAHHKRNASQYDLNALAAGTRGWTGAEIRTCIQNTLVSAMHQGAPDISTSSLLKVASCMTPLSVAQRERIEGLIAWAKDNRIVNAASDAMRREVD